MSSGKESSWCTNKNGRLTLTIAKRENIIQIVGQLQSYLSSCIALNTRAFLLFISCSTALSVQAETRVQGYLSLASDYVYRGISFSDGQLSPQISLSAIDDSGVFASLWLARDDIGGVFNDSQPLDLEVEYQLGYQTLLNSDWSIGVSHAWLEYQTRHQPRNHDYRETRLNISYRDRLGGFISYARDIWTTGLDASTVAFSYRSVGPYQLLFEQELGAVYFDTDAGGSGNTLLSFLRLSFGKRVGRDWLLSLDYHYSDASNDGVLASDRIGSRWVLGTRYHFSL